MTEEFRSGFVTLVGRPNVGKSTLLNQLVGSKVAIVSDRPQTTRAAIRGVRTTADSQVVFVDTPGIHKPRTLLGERTNERALATLGEVDVVCMLVEANAPIGSGDRFIADLVHQVETPKLLVVNKIDRAGKAAVAEHLVGAARDLGDFDAYVPLSARTGDGIAALVEEIDSRLPVGARYYPEGMVTDQPEMFLAAELVREKLLAIARDELPHSITVSVEEMEDVGREALTEREIPEPVLRLRATIHVERESQRGIVIGRGGQVLKDAGTAARHELEALLGVRVYLETRVQVERDWQRRAHALDRLGY
ncbi:MAG TPA: GTPase Era [Acidimicrobiia bacterium]|nr:GTPase Era [Acidimicrobiia bacterium]